MMRKKKVFLFLTVWILISAVSFAFAACGKIEDEPQDNDDAYALTLSGLTDAQGTPLADIAISKSQIKALFESKPVIYTEANPCYASDKTDANGNKIPHSLKGVYLEDLLDAYTQSAPISVYTMLTLSALDNYVTVVTEEVFQSACGGSKMIIAFEYDGVTLTASEQSGALCAVFPDQPANKWARKLSKIEFSTIPGEKEHE
jgi:hypothetical protein